MLAAPGQPARIPVQGLTGWDHVASSLGKGLASVLQAGTELATLGDKVQRTGELATFTKRLGNISTEVREELAGQPVKDWDYAWNAASSARYAEAVQELAPESRESGRELARLYSAQASLEARRDRELGKIEEARHQWSRRVEEAVSSGDEAAASEWVELGRGVFVPEEEAEARLQKVRSRACLSRWQSSLAGRPLETLAELAEAKGEALPQGRAEREGLEQGRQQALRATRRALAMQFSEDVRAGRAPDEATLEQACRAGVLEAAQGQAARAAAVEPDVTAQSAWLRWVDEREDGEEAEAACRLTIATAPLPQSWRMRLLQRVEDSAGVPASDRRALSRRLHALYRSGALGCPGDAESRCALLRLQEEGASLLSGQGTEAVADWLRARQQSAGRWVCFGDEQK